MNSHTMKAQVLERPTRMICRDVEVPEVGPNDVLIRVRVCGISEIDRRLYQGECGIGSGPVVPGHEVLGTVESMGAQVRGLEIGDRVCLDSGFQIGACIYRRSGGKTEQVGEVRPSLGLMGGFAEFMLAPAGRCYRAPDEVDDYTVSQAAHIVHELRTMRGFQQALMDHTLMGASCAILSSRAGLMLTALVRFLGFVPIVAVGAGEHNLDASTRLGADATVDSDRVRDPVDAALKVLDGHGADVVIDVHGGGEIRPEAEGLLADGGRLYSLVEPQSGDFNDTPDTTPQTFPAVFKLLRYERLNLRPTFAMAVPLERVEWAVREWGKDVRLLKAFMASSLQEDFYFEHYRAPVDATLYSK